MKASTFRENGPDLAVGGHDLLHIRVEKGATEVKVSARSAPMVLNPVCGRGSWGAIVSTRSTRGAEGGILKLQSKVWPVLRRFRERTRVGHGNSPGSLNVAARVPLPHAAKV